MAARGLRNRGADGLRIWHWMSSAQGTSRPISTVASKMDSATETFVEEAEPVGVASDRNKLLVLGGNGFVGSHVCKEALKHGVPVSSFNRSGKPALRDSWVEEITWIRGSLLESEKLKDSLQDVSAVISCVGGFGSNEAMRTINGDANIAAISAASESGVNRFVFISAVNFGLPSFVLQGYYEGKKVAEETLRAKFPYGGVILRPGFIHGTRHFGNFNIPISVVGAPLELLFRKIKPMTQIPVVGPFFLPPVKATSVAKAAVRAATDNVIPPGVLDVWSILRLGDQD